MRRIVAAVALVAAPFGLAACHTTNPQTACAEVDAAISGYTLFNAQTDDSGRWAVCSLRNSQTFQTITRCYRYSDHEVFVCTISSSGEVQAA